jgi:hypothetical protein
MGTLHHAHAHVQRSRQLFQRLALDSPSDSYTKQLTCGGLAQTFVTRRANLPAATLSAIRPDICHYAAHREQSRAERKMDREMGRTIGRERVSLQRAGKRRRERERETRTDLRHSPKNLPAATLSAIRPDIRSS